MHPIYADLFRRTAAVLMAIWAGACQPRITTSRLR